MASHRLIDSYLGRLRARLPADTVDELADGLIESWHHHLATGMAPDQAARAAIAEFGPADGLADEFVRHAPGRRTARLLLGTGPAVGLCWGASLIAAKVWTWPIPLSAGAAYVAALLAAVVALLVAATTRRSYRRTRLGVAGALALAGLDTAMIAAVAGLAPTVVWPMGIAVVASLARIGITIGSLPRPRTRSRPAGQHGPPG